MVGLGACTVLMAMAAPSRAVAQERAGGGLPALYTADTDHSSVGFSVLHVGITRVRGQFEEWSAAVTYDADDPTRTSVTVIIDVASLDTNSDDRDADLRSENFFDAAEHPVAVFQSTDVVRSGGDLVLVGELRIKDRVRTVRIPARSLGEYETERTERMGFEGSITLQRKDFGVVNEGNVLERLGVIGKDVAVEIQLSALRFKPTARSYRDGGQRRSVGAVLEEVVTDDGIEAAVDRYAAILDTGGGTFELGLSELVTLGSRLAADGRAADAARILELYVEGNPNDPGGRFWLGEMLAVAGEVEVALHQYRTAVDLDSRRVDAVERIRHLTDSAGRAELVEGRRDSR